MRFIFAMEALENSGLNMEEEDRDRVGVIVSSGIGGLQELEDQIIRMHERGMKRIKPMFILKHSQTWVLVTLLLKLVLKGCVKSVTTALRLPMMQSVRPSVKLNSVCMMLSWWWC